MKVTNFLSIFSKYIIAIILLIAGGFVILSLVSYHPLDPSFNVAFDQKIYNLGGWLGAYIAQPLLEIFGFSAYIFCLFFINIGVRILFHYRLHFFTLRIGSLLLSIIICSFLLSLFNIPNSWEFESVGGYLGLSLGNTYFLQVPIIFKILICFILVTVFLSYSLYIKYNFYQDLTLFIAYHTTNLSKKILPKIASYFKLCVYKLILYIKKTFFGIKGQMNFDKTTKNNIKNAIDVLKKEAQELEVKKNQNFINKNNNAYDNKATDQKIFEFILPHINLLNPTKKDSKISINQELIQKSAQILNKTLQDFGVLGQIIGVKKGPVVTLYEFEPSPGIKSSRIIGLSDDIARSMQAVSTRIAVIAGKNALGIELPNQNREMIFFREIIESAEYHSLKHKLPLALGKDISGKVIIADLTKMPHLLVAGTTGSGKSVAINTMILSLIYRLTPDECKFIMIDPKMLELSAYNNIPHLLTNVVTDPKKAIVALRWIVGEMERRYKLMSYLSVRNIDGYNQKIKSLKEDVLNKKVQTGFDSTTNKPIFHEIKIEKKIMPNIVVIIDEMADLMLVAGKEIEAYIQRLAQMARAAGIHMIVATQRPSVDVITGVIKANFPTRISFQVTSKIDSRTILGEQGAEELLGQGDMLFMYGGSKVTRIHGPFVSDKEVENIVNYLKSMRKPEYVANITEGEESANVDKNLGLVSKDEQDNLYKEAIRIVIQEKKVSTSYIQRRLRIGYNRAANIIERMEQEGIVSPPNNIGRREVVVSE